MPKRSVEVVLINWKRPQNVSQIIEAFRKQTVACTITVCDCHPSPEFELTAATLSQVDRIHRFVENYGPYSRYMPWASYDHEFTYFSDDDMLPGRRCLEHFLGHADRPFGVLGQDGRRLRRDGIYRPDKVRRTRGFEEVDLVVRAYFVRTAHLSALPTMEKRLELGDRSTIEDDILLAVALQREGCFLTPADRDPETSIARHLLPAPHALSKRLDHFDRRTELFKRAAAMGWSACHERSRPPLLRLLRR
jgi:hypothetical protein